MRASRRLTSGAILAGLLLSGCVRHEPYPSYAHYDPYPRNYGPHYYGYGPYFSPYYAPRAYSGFSIVIGKDRHRHHRGYRPHGHRHRW